MAFTTYTGVRLQIPARGDRNWDSVMASVTWTNIAAHDHSGDPKGLQLGTSALSSNSVTGAKFRLSNAEYLRARNAANSADINILRVNSSDQLELAIAPILTAAALSVNGSIGYASNVFSGYMNGVLRQFATLNGTEVFTNKDIDGGTASNASRITLPKASKSTLDGLTRKQGTVVYASDVNKIYSDDGTTLREVGSTSSSGINYLPINNLEWNFESGQVTGFSTYANTTPAATPEVSPGGTPSGSYTFTASSSSPLRGTYSGLVTKDAANRQGTGVRTSAFTIDAADTGRNLQISFDYDATAANYVAGDLGVFISDGTSIITPSVTALPASKGTFQAQFTTSTSTSYRLIFHTTSTNANAWTVKVDNIQLGPQLLTVAPAIQDWQSFTPTITGFGTVSSLIAFWRRVGDSIEVAGRFVSGVSTAVVAQFGLPSGLSIDTTKVVGNAQQQLGTVYAAAAVNSIPAAGRGAWPIIPITSTSTTSVGVALQTNISATHFVVANGSDLVVSTNAISFEFKCPIATWSSNSTPATSFTEYAFNISTSDAADTTSFGYGAAGTPTPGALTTARLKRVRFATPIQPTDFIRIEVQNTSLSGQTTWSEVPEDQQGIAQFTWQNTSTYGIGWRAVANSTTDIDVEFGQYAYPSGSTFGSAGLSWGSVSARWRVRKSAGQNPGEIQRRLCLSAHRNGSSQTGVNPNASAVQITFNSLAANGKHGYSSLPGWSTANGNFVAPFTGIYLFSVRISITSANVLNTKYTPILLVGSTFGGASQTVVGGCVYPIAGQAFETNLVGRMNLTAGDTVWVGLFGLGNNSSSTLTMTGSPDQSAIEIEYIGAP